MTDARKVQADSDGLGSFGWRARIGILTPGVVSETVPLQFYRMAPPGVTLMLTDLGLRASTVEENLATLPRIDDAARQLKGRGATCIMLAGTPPVVVGGYGSDRPLIERLREVSGLPASTDQTACVEALSHLGASRLAVVTPFTDDINELLRVFLERSGFVVAGLTPLSTAGVAYVDLMGTPVRIPYQVALEAFRRADRADGLYLAGAPMPVVPVVGRLERELGVPVVASLQATLWKALALSDIHVPIQGYGRLLRGTGD